MVKKQSDHQLKKQEPKVKSAQVKKIAHVQFSGGKISPTACACPKSIAADRPGERL